jgi:hypothetical protein
VEQDVVDQQGALRPDRLDDPGYSATASVNRDQGRVVRGDHERVVAASMWATSDARSNPRTVAVIVRTCASASTSSPLAVGRR